MDKDKYCLVATHYGSAKRVFFTEKQRVLKAQKHSELRDPEFIQGRVKRTIESPDFAYQDLAEPLKRQVLYLIEYKVSNELRYTKVVIEDRGNSFFVISAFRPNYIKEENKTKLIYRHG